MKKASLLFPLRSYQKRIVHEVEGKNSLIILPTGAGKTLIAVEIIGHLLTSDSGKGEKAIFFVPTCLLVEQQAIALRERLSPLIIAEYMGGKKLELSFDVLVTTPSAFLVAQNSCQSLQWNNFRIVVFDEVHHVIKDHPYRKIAHGISTARREDESLHLQVIGLTASLTYSVSDSTVRKSIESLVRELQISHMATGLKTHYSTAL